MTPKRASFVVRDFAMFLSRMISIRLTPSRPWNSAG